MTTRNWGPTHPAYPKQRMGATMSKRTYQCWCPDHGGREDESRDVEADNAEDAARQYAERLYQDEPPDDHESVAIHMRCEGGPLMSVTVHAAYSLDYRADDPVYL